MPASQPPARAGSGGGLDHDAGVGRAFLRLGLTSFGGPVAHLGFFRTEFVERRRWLGEAQYADLVALAQFLPGPASSQVGMGIGLQRAGIPGSLRAWLGFTLPSAILLISAGVAVGSGVVVPGGAVAGLKVAAVAVVAVAVVQMARTLCVGWLRALVAIASGVAVLAVPTVWMPSLVLVGAAVVGLMLVRDSEGGPGRRTPRHGGPVSPPGCRMPPVRVSGPPAARLPVVARLWPEQWWSSSPASTVQGVGLRGGQVVRPMLEEVVVGSGAVSQADPVAGDGLANAVRGRVHLRRDLGAVAGGLPPGSRPSSSSSCPGTCLAGRATGTGSPVMRACAGDSR